MGTQFSKIENEKNNGTLIAAVSNKLFKKYDESCRIKLEEFPHVKQLLFDAVGYNSRFIYKQLADDPYICSKESTFSGLQHVFGFHNPRPTTVVNSKKKKKENVTLYLNMHIKKTELQRHHRKLDSKNTHHAYCLVFYLKSYPWNKYFTTVQQVHNTGLHWNEHLTVPIRTHKEFKDELIVGICNFYHLSSLNKNISNSLSEPLDIQAVRKIILSAANNTGNFITFKTSAIGRINLSEELMDDCNELTVDLMKRTGKIKGKIHLQAEVSEKPTVEVLTRQHLALNQLWLLYEREISNGSHISIGTEILIEQHRVLNHLSTFELWLIRWIAVSKIHNTFQFDFSVLNNIIEKILYHISESEIPNVILEEFQKATKILLISCLNRIIDMNQDNHALLVLQKILLIKPITSNCFHQAASDDLNSLKKDHETTAAGIEKIKETIDSTTKMWWNQVNKIQGHKSGDEISPEDLEYVMNILQEVQSYCGALIVTYSPIFKHLGIDLETIFQNSVSNRIHETVLPMVQTVSQNIISNKDVFRVKSSAAANYTIFEYYQKLTSSIDIEEKNFAVSLFQILKQLQSKLIKDSHHSNKHEFDNVIKTLVPYWIEIAVWKAMTCIEKAVHLDGLQPIDENTKYSSSAVDLLGVLEELKIFWNDLLEFKTVVHKNTCVELMQGVKKCLELYVYFMTEKCCSYMSSEILNKTPHHVEQKWVATVYDIAHVKENLKYSLFPANLHADIDLSEAIEILSIEQPFASYSICDLKSLLNLENVKLDTINQVLLEQSKELFIALRKEFNPTSKFTLLYIEIWNYFENLFNEVADVCLMDGAQTSFFKHMCDTLKDILTAYRRIVSNSSINFTISKDLETKLFVNATSTEELLAQYYMERYLIQNAIESASHGTLTVTMSFKNNILRITILNVKNLVPVDWKTSCDPYVQVLFVPELEYKHIEHFHTKAKTKTTCALYDESFELNVEKTEFYEHGYVRFAVEEKELMATIHLGEAFWPINKILTQSSGQDSNKQIHLKLTRPPLDTHIIRTLRSREHYDKEAKSFLKSYKSMLNQTGWATIQEHIHHRHSLVDIFKSLHSS